MLPHFHSSCLSPTIVPAGPQVAMVRTILGLRTVPALTSLGPEGLIALMMLGTGESQEGEGNDQGGKPTSSGSSGGASDASSKENKSDGELYQIDYTELWAQYRTKFGTVD